MDEFDLTNLPQVQPLTDDDIGTLGKYIRLDPRSAEEDLLRRVVRTLLGSETSVTMEVRFPDISFYQGKPNFDVMATQTIAVIIRAGQNVWIDPEFLRNWAEAKRVRLRRGVYWFYDDRISPQQQADILIGLIRNDLPELEVVCDWEKTYGGPYGGLANVISFLSRIGVSLPTVKLCIYTGYYWFRDHSSPTANAQEYNYIVNHAVRLWEAWYTSNPVYVSIPAPWSSLTHWQFGTPAEGSKYGVQSGNIDMNWFNGTLTKFKADYSIGGTIPPGTIDYPYDGAVHLKTRAYNSDAHVITIKRGDIHVHWTGGRSTVLAMAQRTGASIAVNGGDYNPYTGDPTGLLAVDGRIVSPREGYMPFLNISADGKISIEEWNSLILPYNAVALRRMLVRAGQISKDTSAAWYERHPKTAYGVTASGELLMVEVDGRTSVSAGITLFELAQLCIDHGAVRAADAGGGGDCTVVINGVVVNVPIADTTPGELRPVADAVIVFKIGGNVIPGTAVEKLGKTVTIRSSAQVVSGNDTGGVVPAGGTVNFYKIVQDVQHPGDANYQWLQLDEAGTRFVNYYYPSSTMLTLQRFTIKTMPDPGSGQTVPFTLALSIQGFKQVTISGVLEKL